MTTSTILHLSDLHVQARADHPHNRRLGGLVARIVADYRAVQPIVIITGDLVDDGERAQYRELLRLLRPIKDAGLKILAAPGNHDCGPMGNSYLASARVEYQRHVVADLMGIGVADTASDVMANLYPMVHRIDGITYVGLDSVVGMIGGGMHFARGAVGAPQLAKLRTIIDYDHGRQPIVVYLHHHPFDRNFTMALRDSAELMAVLANRVDLLLFGHEHRVDVWPGPHRPILHGIRGIIASGQTTAEQGGTCEVHRACFAAGQLALTAIRLAV